MKETWIDPETVTTDGAIRERRHWRNETPQRWARDNGSAVSISGTGKATVYYSQSGRIRQEACLLHWLRRN